jgi:hypothetical protein
MEFTYGSTDDYEIEEDELAVWHQSMPSLKQRMIKVYVL